MKLILNTAAVLLLITFTACKKNKVATPAGEVAKIKTMTIKTSSGVSNSVTNVYDEMGRVSSVTYADNSKRKYTYTTGKISIASFNATGVGDGGFTYLINPAGLAIEYYNNYDPTYKTFFTYNGTRQLTSEVSVHLGDTLSKSYHMYNADGNRIADSIFNGAIFNSRQYVYTNVISTTENVNGGVTMYGLTNKNCLLQSSSKVSTSTIIPTYYSVPVTDALGRIIKSVITSQGATSTLEYTYY